MSEGKNAESTTNSFDADRELDSSNAALGRFVDGDEVVFPRDPLEQDAIERLFQSLRDHQFTSDNKVSEEINSYYRSIEQGFAFSAVPSDEYFNPLQVEALLDQASDLLDRANRDRREWDDLADKWTTLLLGLFEYSELDKIHAEEEAAGAYEMPYRISGANFSAEVNNASHQEKIWKVVDEHIKKNLSSKKLNEVITSTALTSWLSGLVPYTWNGQSFAGYVKHSFDGISRDVSDHAFEASYPISLNRAWEQLYGNVAQKLAHQSQSIIGGIRRDGLEYQAEWDWRNVAFQKRRTLVARQFQDIKVKLALGPDGLLNAGKRLPHLKRRFHNDFRSVIARLEAVEAGLERVFGLKLSLPSESSSGQNYFDDCVVWTREAIQRVISFSQQDQSTILPFSLRSVLGNSAWSSGLKSGTWEVDLGDALPTNFRHVRLRGISATSENTGRDRLWSLSIEPPKSAVLRLNDGTSTTIDQSDFNRHVILGRVTGRTNPRAPDIAGVATLHNLSPLGKWRLSISELGLNPSFGDLEDITIDLHLVFQHRRV